VGLAPKDSLTELEIQVGLKSVMRDGLASQAMATLTAGPFLVAFALKLGASNLFIGLLAAIPALAQLIQIPSVYLVEQVRNRRAISVSATAVSRGFLILVALIPFLTAPQAGLAILILALFFYSGVGAISTAGWNSWMRDLIPMEELGSFFARRMRYAMALGLALSLLAGIFLDLWKKTLPAYELRGYSVLFLLGAMAGWLGSYFISTIPEPRMVLTAKRRTFTEMLSKPFRDANFRKLLLFMGSWAFAINLAAPFFTVYMLKRLEMSMSFLIGMMVLSQSVNIFFLKIWGGFSDHFSNKSVLRVCAPLYLLCVLGWTFTTMPERYFLTVPLLIVIHIALGIAVAGTTLAAGNIGLKLAPKGQATAYLATSSLVNSVAAGLAPILGGRFADFFSGRSVSWILKWTSPGGEIAIQTLNLQQWDFFFFFAFLIGLYSIHRLTTVEERGEVEERIVIRQLVTEVRSTISNLSTVGGLQQMFQFPVSVARVMLGRRSGGGSEHFGNSTR